MNLGYFLDVYSFCSSSNVGSQTNQQKFSPYLTESERDPMTDLIQIDQKIVRPNEKILAASVVSGISQTLRSRDKDL